MPKVFKNRPLNEITLRKFEKPSEDYKDNLRKLCISLGLLQPGDGRDVIVRIVHVLLVARKKKEILTSQEIMEYLEKLPGATSSNIRWNLRKLNNLGLIEKISAGYRIKEFLPLKEVLNSHVKPFLIDESLKRIEEYCDAVDEK